MNAPEKPRTNAVQIANLTKIYDGRRVLDQISLDIAPGEFVAVLGASGTGKTTLLRILLGLEQADEGRINVPDVRSVVFQEPRLIPALPVWKNVVLRDAWTTANRQRAEAALSEVGLSAKSRSWPGTLSGGEAQRVALARALVREPRLLLLDEPFAALDALTRIRMHTLVEQLWRQHDPAVFLVTHDVDEAILLADRVIVLSKGRIRFDQQISSPRPRLRSGPGFQELRERLLAELDVTSPALPGNRAAPATA